MTTQDYKKAADYDKKTIKKSMQAFALLLQGYLTKREFKDIINAITLK